MAHIERIHRLDDFQQPASVVEEFLEFTGTVFPGLVMNGGKFAREGVEASRRARDMSDDERHSRLYGASNIFRKYPLGDSPSDMLLQSTDMTADRRHKVVLYHRYFNGDGTSNPIASSYFVYAGKLLATSLLTFDYRTNIQDANGLKVTQLQGNPDYVHDQTVALATGREGGFERGAVDVAYSIGSGRINAVKGANMLVGEEEWKTLYGLYAPAQPALGLVSSL